MGGGTPKNKQNNSAKITPSERVRLSGTGAGGVGGDGSAPSNACIIAFDTVLEVPSMANPPLAGADLFFIPTDSDGTFNVWFGSVQLGIYTGTNASLMWRCTNDGFEYHGKVTSTERAGDEMRISCKVETFGRE